MASIVTLVLVGGPPGTGKTTLADAVGARLGWPVLNSDRIRKELAGLSFDADGRTAFGTGIYTPEWTVRTYGELLHRARTLLGHGESAILDASWTSAELRSAAADVARSGHALLVELRCTAGREVTERRLRARSHGPSDAGPEIGAVLAAAAAPWPGAIAIDTGRPNAEVVVVEALAAIQRHGLEHV